MKFIDSIFLPQTKIPTLARTKKPESDPNHYKKIIQMGVKSLLLWDLDMTRTEPKSELESEYPKLVKMLMFYIVKVIKMF